MSIDTVGLNDVTVGSGFFKHQWGSAQDTGSLPTEDKSKGLQQEVDFCSLLLGVRFLTHLSAYPFIFPWFTGGSGACGSHSSEQYLREANGSECSRSCASVRQAVHGVWGHEPNLRDIQSELICCGSWVGQWLWSKCRYKSLLHPDCINCNCQIKVHVTLIFRLL